MESGSDDSGVEELFPEGNLDLEGGAQLQSAGKRAAAAGSPEAPKRRKGQPKKGPASPDAPPEESPKSRKARREKKARAEKKERDAEKRNTQLLERSPDAPPGETQAARKSRRKTRKRLSEQLERDELRQVRSPDAPAGETAKQRKARRRKKKRRLLSESSGESASEEENQGAAGGASNNPARNAQNDNVEAGSKEPQGGDGGHSSFDGFYSMGALHSPCCRSRRSGAGAPPPGDKGGKSPDEDAKPDPPPAGDGGKPPGGNGQHSQDEGADFAKDGRPKIFCPTTGKTTYGEAAFEALERACVEDEETGLSDMDRVALAYDYLLAFAPATCANCNLRWYREPSWREGVGAKPDYLPATMATAGWFGAHEEFCGNCWQRGGPSPAFDAWGAVDYGRTFPEIDALTYVEERCIALVSPIMSVFTNLPGGGCSYQGHVSNCHVDVTRWLQKLPPKPDELGIVLVKRRTRGAMGGAARPPFRIRPYVVHQAILRLIHEQRGVPDSYGQVEVDEAALRAYYGWAPGVDPGYEHDVSPRELEVDCEADEAPPVDRAVFVEWTEQTDLPFARRVLAVARKTAPALQPWDAVRRAMAARAKAKRAEKEAQEEGEESESAEEGEEEDDSIGMLQARNTERVPVRWFAALFAEEAEEPEGGINDAWEESADPFAEIAQELEVVRCFRAAPPSKEETYQWAEPERQAQDQAAKEQVANRLIEQAQQPGFCRGAQPSSGEQHAAPAAPSPKPRATPEKAAAGGEAAQPAGGFAGTPPASLASLQGTPGGPPRDHADPKHRQRERVSQAEATKLLSEDTPGYIRNAYPKIYQCGLGCPTERDRTSLDFRAYALHGMMAMGDGRAMRHPSYRFLIFDTTTRFQTLSGSVSFRLSKAADFDAGRDLQPQKKKELLRKIVQATEEIPGTLGSRQLMDRKLQAMIDQLECETSGMVRAIGQRPEAEYGQIAGLFSTTTTGIYRDALLNKWINAWYGVDAEALLVLPQGERRRRYFEDATSNPLIVAQFAATWLEVVFWQDLRMVRGTEGAEGVDEQFATFDWGSGRIPHLHAIRWIRGSPRCDTLVDKEKGDRGRDRFDGADASAFGTAAAEFFQHYIAEWYPQLPVERAEDVSAAKQAKDAGQEWEDPCMIGPEDYVGMLLEGGAGMLAEAAAGDQERFTPLRYLQKLLDTVQFHDNHEPSAHGRPQKWQNCAKVEAKTAGTDHEVVYCGKNFQKPLVNPGYEHIAEDPRRDGLLKYHSARNNIFLNNYCPLRAVKARANVDDQAILTVDGLRRYLSKYLLQDSRNEVSSDIANTFDGCLAAAREQGKGLLSGMYKMFNKLTGNCQTIGQYELCHHMLGLPAYLSTRPFVSTALDPSSRVLNLGAERAEELLRASVYEKYLLREEHAQGPHMTHPINGADYSDPVAWQGWVRGSSFYRWLMFVFTRRDGQGFTSQFRKEKPRVMMLQPRLNLYRRKDPAKADENRYHIRLLLRTYCNLEMAAGGITDASLAAEQNIDALEALVDAFVKEKASERGPFKKCCRCPRHIREQWRKSRQQWENYCKKKENDPAPPPEYETYEGKVLGGEDGGAAFGKDADEDTAEQEAERLACQKVQTQLQAAGINTAQVRAAYAKIAHPPLREELDALQCIQKMRRLLLLLQPQKNPRAPTKRLLKAALKELRQKRTGNKAQLKERLCNLFNGKGPAEPAGDRQPQGDAPERVTEQRQELDGRGKNPFEDGRDVAFYDDIEAQVLAERQALLPYEDLMCSGADEGPAGQISDDEIRRAMDASLAEAAAKAGGSLTSGEKVSERIRDLLESLSEPAGGEAGKLPALDPTQAALAMTILRHYASAERKILRIILQGLAGTGKSYTIADVLRALVEVHGRTNCFKLLAPTGVASQALAAFGCETIDSVLKTVQKELSENQIDELADAFAEVVIIIIDEISMCGRVKTGRVSRNLDLIMRRVWIRRQVAADPFYDVRTAPSCAELFPRGFGGLDVLFIGDFGQIAPVKDRSLMDKRREKIGSNMNHELSNVGLERFADFLRDDAPDLSVHAIRLRRLYRNKDKGADLRRATTRIRDFAPGMEDYELLAARDHEKLREAGETWLDDATWICFENRFVGERNGQRLGERARAAGQKIHRIGATFSCPRARELAGQKKFQRLRSTLHLSLGSRVMLTTNTLWGRRVVPLGLCNGARGLVRGFRYDGQGNVEYVLVHFEDWAGEAFCEEWGPKVVPVPVCEEEVYQGRYSMTGLPLVLAGTLTGHKAQGLTLPEGTVVDFRSCRTLGQLLGLVFVALTRCEGLSRLAVANLPPFHEFFQGRDTQGFRERAEFEKRFDELHEKTMREVFGDVEEAELHRRAARGTMTEEQFADLKEQLSQRGVVDIPESTEEAIRKFCGKQRVNWNDLRRFIKPPRGGRRQTLVAAAKLPKAPPRAPRPKAENQPPAAAAPKAQGGAAANGAKAGPPNKGDALGSSSSDDDDDLLRDDTPRRLARLRRR